MPDAIEPTASPAEARPLQGARVVAFESRMAGSLAEMIARKGAVPVEAPSMRELPLGESAEAIDFARRLGAGDVDVVIFLTGVGARHLAREVEAVLPMPEFVEALRRVRVVVRGPKPMSVMREWDVPVAVTVPEPNTWHDLLAALDAKLPVDGLRVAVQLYGKPHPELLAALRERGADAFAVPVYRWALPEDTGPLRSAVSEIVRGRMDGALFTSAQQAVHLIQIAEEEGKTAEVLAKLRDRVVVGSIGPTTTETLLELGIRPDFQPEHPKLGHLANALADRWATLRKPASEPAEPADHPAPVRDPLLDSRFLRACRREPVDVTPIWLMRQAGRYMAEYRAIRDKVSFLELCGTPHLAAQVTLEAAEILGVDAAILFADILLILRPMGLDLEFAKGEGPLIHNPVREPADVDRVRPFSDPGELGHVYEAIRLIRADLPENIPLIGFAGAPFTLACYAIEGGSSRHHERAKTLMYRDPGAWDVLMARFVDGTVAYLKAQVEAGAQALQIFDSWVGSLGPADYRRFVRPHMARLFDALPADVPTIHFGTGTATLLELQKEAGGDVIGLDWRVELGEAWDRLGDGVAVQGNLDPVLLLAPEPELRRQARRVLDQAGGRPGHIFNLGHGVLPQTPVENVRRLIDEVRSH